MRSLPIALIKSRILWLGKVGMPSGIRGRKGCCPTVSLMDCEDWKGRDEDFTLVYSVRSWDGLNSWVLRSEKKRWYRCAWSLLVPYLHLPWHQILITARLNNVISPLACAEEIILLDPDGSLQRAFCLFFSWSKARFVRRGRTFVPKRRLPTHLRP